MPSGSKGDRILETTRGKVLALLRVGPKTTDELAAALGLTDNAVRAHLATLERDRLVQSAGERREGKVGKPATLYRITPDVEQLFSKAYLPLLSALLAVLGERLKPRELRPLLRKVGQRLAQGLEQPSGDLAKRVGAASILLNQLGGLSSVEELQAGKHYAIQSRGCPVGVAVRNRPEVCEAMEALVSELTGGRVRSCCDRGERPSCCFEVRSEEA
jgi:predicted ArsR family transcriptional regulator